MISQEVIEAAQAAHKTFYPRGPFASCQLAQFGLESGWGKYASGKNNFFGIKATEAQIAAGQATPRTTKEQRADGSWYTITAYFADYASLTDGFTAHAALLCHPWYKDCIAATTPEAYCRALQTDHYATALNYAVDLIQIINSMDLTKYDLPPDPVVDV
jgi:flagellum-specific peptidoglycan hydrolase FlgJ